MRLATGLGISMWFVAIATSAAAPQPVRPHDSKWTAPASQSTRANPLTGRSDVQSGGNKLFHERCSVCHGEDARGTARGPDLTAARVQDQSDGVLFWKISSGNTRTGMPTFSFLPELQRWQLVAHVRAHARAPVTGRAGRRADAGTGRRP